MTACGARCPQLEVRPDSGRQCGDEVPLAASSPSEHDEGEDDARNSGCDGTSHDGMRPDESRGAVSRSGTQPRRRARILTLRWCIASGPSNYADERHCQPGKGNVAQPHDANDTCRGASPPCRRRGAVIVHRVRTAVGTATGATGQPMGRGKRLSCVQRGGS